MGERRYITKAIGIFILTIFYSMSLSTVVIAQEIEIKKADNLNNRAVELSQQGKDKEAIALAEEALAIKEKVLGPMHTETADILLNLAIICLTSDLAKAEHLLKRALTINEKNRPVHSSTATNLALLALLHSTKGNNAKAEQIYKRALEIDEKVLGPNHPDTVSIIKQLGLFYKNIGDYAKAVPLFKRELEFEQKTLGPEHKDIANVLNNLGWSYYKLGYFSKAEPLLKRVLSIREKVLGQKHSDTVESLSILIDVYLKMGEFAKAEPLYNRLPDTEKKAIKPSELEMKKLFDKMVSEFKLGKYAEALKYGEKLLPVAEKELGPENSVMASLQSNLATIYFELGKFDKAETFYKRALVIDEKSFGPNHATTAASLNSLAVFYLNRGDYFKAEPLLKRALAIREKALGPEHADTIETRSNIAAMNDMKKKKDEVSSSRDYSTEKNTALKSTSNSEASKFTAKQSKKSDPISKDENLSIDEINDKLISASENGDLATVKDLLSMGGDVNVKAENDKTALIAAVRGGNMDLIRFLIEKGADVNAKNKYGDTAINEAAGRKDIDIVRLLIDNGANINARGHYGWTALISAAFDDNTDMVRLLIEKGADVNAKDDQGNTALMKAKIHKYNAVVEILTSAMRGIKNNNPASLDEEMISASERGDLMAVKDLLSKGANVNANIEGGWTGLMWAAFEGKTETIRLLIEKGAKVNAKDNSGWTALTKAVRNRHSDAARLLIQNGADVNAISMGGISVLMLAVDEGDADMVRLLIEKGADINVRDALGFTPKKYAEIRQQHAIAQILSSAERGETSIKESRLGEVTELKWQAHDLYQQGRFQDAIPLAERLLAIREEDLGPEHPETILSLNYLAELYQQLGDYSKTEQLLKRSLAIREKVIGMENKDTLESMSALGLLYLTIGDNEKAESLLNRVVEISEKIFDPNHPETARSLNNLAALYIRIGDYSKAEPLVKRAFAIGEKTLGSYDPDMATRINNLAVLYMNIGDFVKAEPLLKRAVEISEKTNGLDHPDTATSLSNVAHYYMEMSDFTKAEPLLKRTLEIREKALGLEHPDISRSLNALAFLFSLKGEYIEGQRFFKRAQTIDTKTIDHVMGFTTEAQKMKFLTSLTADMNAFLSLTSQHLIDNSQAKQDALDAWLRRKGVVLEAQRRFQEALVYSDDAEARQVFQQLAEVRARISQLTFAGPGKEGPVAYQKRLSDLQTEKDKLDTRLSQMSQLYAASRTVAKADSLKLAKTLPESSCLIEFAKLDFFNFKATKKEPKWLPAHYLAFVLHAGQSGNVGLIDLGQAEQLDKAIVVLKKQISEGKMPIGDKRDSILRDLYDLVFAPLKKELGGSKKIFISPDGDLNLIPFEILQDTEGRYLIENYTFNYLVAGRDLAGFGQVNAKGTKPLLIGDPDFDFDSGKKGKAKIRASEPEDVASVAGRSADLRQLKGFNPLPGTREEIKGIQALMGSEGSEVYTGKEALEKVLNTSQGPRILHLATHGFFLGDQTLSVLMDEWDFRGAGGIRPIQPKGQKVKFENPLLRSGIALAGANRALKSGGEQSSGLVTAEKILGLNLRGTDMVVLSACETGLGEIKAGEGVFGLRRAFTQAGAKSLVMSMWSVPDKETKELMLEFYRNLLENGMDRAQALRQAELNEMDVVKKRYGAANPYYWGAFVFMGQPN
jgi:ankyrin repeat protein/CHAT domain-containing protein/Flp pilus assembly protein TadD